MRRALFSGCRGIGIGAALSFALVACTLIPEGYGNRDLIATWDPEFVERGRYLVYGPGHCVSCHGDPTREAEMASGQEIPLSGGRQLTLGMAGKVTAPNLTSDAETGTGALSDSELANALRYGLSHNGRVLLPMMSTAELSDYDVQSILSFLRVTDPVSAVQHPRESLSPIGKLGVLLLKPHRPSVPPRVQVEPSRSAEYGRYLAYSVANCRGCHTKRSKLTGRFIGQDFAGGDPIKAGERVFTPPDLTPSSNGVTGSSSEQQFIARFRANARSPGDSPMPWYAFNRMSDNDIGAIYRYLRTLPGSARSQE